MISDFQTRFVEVLGPALPVPFQGRVGLVPAPNLNAGPALVLTLRRIATLDTGMGGLPPQVVQGHPEARRVMRLRCLFGLEILPANGEGRAQQIAGLEQSWYVLDAPDWRNGRVFQEEEGDPGFAVDVLRPVEGLGPVESATRIEVLFEVEGLFWPTTLAGATGPQIREVRFGSPLRAVEMFPAFPRITAGGAAVSLRLRVPLIAVTEEGEDPIAPFRDIVVELDGPGMLASDDAQPGSDADTLLLEVSEGEVSLSYTPPNDPGTSTLRVHLDNGNGEAGKELGRFGLSVEAGS